MEPMALGSPSSPGNTTFLPQFLMGDPMTPPRTTTLSPTKLGGRSLAFGQSPTSPKDTLNRSSAFRNPLSPTSGNFHHHGTGQSLNASVSGGPPTQGLFDSLASTEKNFITSPFSPAAGAQQSLNDSTVYNVTTPRRPSIIPGPKHNFTASPFPNHNSSVLGQNNSTGLQNAPVGAECWVTVFGFPQSATSMILSHFSQCGTIVNKMQPQNSGNWLHLRFTSRLECDRALNFNQKVLNNFFMIGVTRCKDPSVLELEQRDDMENSSFVGNQTPRSVSMAGNSSSLRPLAHIAYKTVQSPADVVASPSAPTKSSGILDRAMDFFLGW